MYMHTLKDRLRIAIKNRWPILITGAPGIGKSDGVEQIAKELKYDLLILHPVVSDATDFKGQPWVIDGKAVFLPFENLDRMITAKRPLIVFIDDMGQAPALVQAACMQLLLARSINGKEISKHVTFIGATNRRKDLAGVTGILEPVKGRFFTIIELKPDIETWLTWAAAHNVPLMLRAFLRYRPHLLCTDEATRDIVNHPNPRNWAHVAGWLAEGITDLETIAGCVGEAAAIEATGFFNMFTQLPNIKRIITNPDSEAVPVDPAARYAVVGALVGQATKVTIKNILQYAKRMGTDFETFLVLDMIRNDPDLEETRAVTMWRSAHPNVQFPQAA